MSIEDISTVVLITGGFDPIHSGHISYIKAAREFIKNKDGILVVGVNSDQWLVRKKGKFFLPFEERACIIGAINGVDHVTAFNDDDNTAKDAISIVRKNYPNALIVFANGGDRNGNNIPEMDHKDNKIAFAFGVGGNNKQNSSSWILNNWTK